MKMCFYHLAYNLLDKLALETISQDGIVSRQSSKRKIVWFSL